MACKGWPEIPNVHLRTDKMASGTIKIYLFQIPTHHRCNGNSVIKQLFSTCLDLLLQFKFTENISVAAFQEYVVGQVEAYKEAFKDAFKDMKESMLQLNAKLDTLVRNAGLSTTFTELPNDICFPLRLPSQVEELEAKLDEDRNLRDTLVINIF